MTREIKKVGVLGAGTMGSGIAALLAKAGIEVVILDKFEGYADKAVARMVKAPVTDAFNSGFMTAEHAKLIKTGTTDDNLDMLADCDWIIETILPPKPKDRQDLYKQVQKIVRPDTLFSSNTSMDTTGEMTYDQDDNFKRRFANVHFFNPPPTMSLVEVIRNEKTAPETIETFKDFCDKALGKKVVECKDERGFIANRIGIYFMERTIKETLDQGFSIEDADAILGPAFGFPMGPFRLADEVGLPVIDHVRADFHDNLPESDHFQQIFTGNEDLRAMMEEGYVGNRKDDSLGGYYRKKTDEGKAVKDENGRTIIQVRDLETGAYSDTAKGPFYKFEKQIKKYGGLSNFFESDDPAAKFAWPVIRDSLLYTLEHAKELAFDIQSIDDAMRAGFNWEMGPFQMLDKIGVEWFSRKLRADGYELPDLLKVANREPFYQVHDQSIKVRHFDGSFVDIEREEGALYLEDIKLRSKPLISHHSADLWDIGDGVTCLEFKSQQNTIDPSILYVMNESINMIGESGGKYKGMVIYNDGIRFSVGANLKLAEIFMDAADGKKNMNLIIDKDKAVKGLHDMMHELVYQGQSIYTALNQAPFPVVAAPKGQAPKSKTTVNFAFGGGCEVLLSSDKIVAGPDMVIGLPEVGVGLIPAWAGSSRDLARSFENAQFNGPMSAITQSMMKLANPMQGTSTSSQDAQKKLWLGNDDKIVMNPERVLAEAKAQTLKMASGYKPKPLPTFHLPGPSGRGAIRMQIDQMYESGLINHIDVQVADRLATALTGGEMLEREEVRHHVDSNHDEWEALIGRKEKGALNIHERIPLNWNRMMQIEREGIVNAADDRENVWPRLRQIVNTNRPLRETVPDDAPTPNDMRDAMVHRKLPLRDVTGKPLTGKDASTLKAMADMTAEIYGLDKAMRKAGKKPLQMLFSELASGFQLLKQIRKTRTTIGKVFENFDM